MPLQPKYQHVETPASAVFKSVKNNVNIQKAMNLVKVVFLYHWNAFLSMGFSFLRSVMCIQATLQLFLAQTTIHIWYQRTNSNDPSDLSYKQETPLQEL